MNKENAHLFLPLIQALIDGKQLQYKYNRLSWEDFENDEEIGFYDAPEYYRINTMTNEQIWKSRAEAHEENYLQMLKRIDDVISERDEAIRSCHIWQKGHAELVAERDYLLNLLQLNQPERKHIGRWGYNRQEFTSPYINQANE